MIERVVGRMTGFVLAFLILAALAGPAAASPPPGTCFAVQATAVGDRPPVAFRCRGIPIGYERATLWLRLPMARPLPAHDATLLVHSTRFDRLTAVFVFADGTRAVQGVRRGAFGQHWRIGGQIEFRPQPRAAALTAVWLKIDRLQGYALVRARLVPSVTVARQFDLCAALIGAALALLAVTALYNVALAAAVRRRLFLWHGLWAATMVGWGLIWSHGALFAVPGIAGTTASQLCTIIAGLAILFATLSATAALRDTLSPAIRRAILGAGVGVVLLGLWSVVPGADLGMVGTGFSVLILSILAAIGSGLAIGYRQGKPDARDLLVAWTVPMLMLGATQVVDFDTSLFGGGAQIAVLFASAFQAVCLSALTTRRLGILRTERDAAIASEIALAEVAERDALTGLLNRRGFVRRCDRAFGDRAQVPFGLLLIDVDRFKRINDRFGHEVGDAVLVGLGTRLRALEDRHACLAGRLGGEEFLIGISGLPAPALRRFADQVRGELGRGDDAGPGHPGVTVSIGIACGTGSGPFAALYGTADRALYAAKGGGRDRVVFAEGSAADADRRVMP